MSDKLDYLPEEMRDAQTKLNATMRRVYKAQKQVKLWIEEKSLAEEDLRTVEKWYGTISMRWNPSTNTMDPISNPELEEVSP